MRVVFFGTGEFAVSSVREILLSAHEVAAVVTQPDKKRGRGMNVLPTAVKAFVQQAAPEAEILQPPDPAEKSFREHLERKKAQVFVVVDYGKILPKELLAIPEKFCVNLHPSLLPRHRGASPVNYAILEGDKETGATVIRMNERMDAGDIILQSRVEIGNDETSSRLFERLSKEGAKLLVKALDLIAEGKTVFIKQDESKATQAPAIKKSDGLIDWEKSASFIARQIRAFEPWPSAFTYLGGKMLKICAAGEAAGLADEGSKPGEIIDAENFVVNTANGALRVTEVQIEGKKRMAAKEFLRGHDVAEGMILGD